MKTDTGNDITVTTATRTEDEVRASLGAPKAEEPPAAAATAVADAGDEPEAEGARPDADASEAGRVLRSNRLKERKTRLTDEVDTYEESIKLLGGTPPALEKREYKTPQDELDHLTKRRFELAKLNTQLLKGARRPAAQPAARPAQPAAAAAAADKGPELPKFEFAAGKEFPTWEQWQEKNPDGDYTLYISEFNNKRDDARDAWREQVADIKQQHASAAARQAANAKGEADAVATIETATATFKTEHADYDEVTGQVNLDHLGDNRLRALRVAMLYEGDKAPQILYYLGKHPDEVKRIEGAQNPAQLYSLMGEFRVSAKAYASSASAAAPAGRQPAAAAAPAAAAPAKPKPGAPAPLAAVVGGAIHTRSAAQLAEDDEDADSYIDARMAETKPRRRSG